MNLKEARNVGEWLEARLHLSFTEIADSMFGDGRLTRNERISLSSAIGAALDAFHLQVEEKASQLYGRDPWAEPKPDMSVNVIESGFVPLVERAVRGDGTIPLKLIKPGWGTTGYYPAAVLEKDGPTVFTKGLKMYWNHPTAMEEAERPEGDLNSLAAELVDNARYDANGVDGPGLYANAKVFEAYQGAVNELAPHIGVSIRAMGPATNGTMEGRQGAIIQGIKMARSVDFVTQPGAGGKILDLFESARRPAQTEAQLPPKKGVDMELEKQLKEAQDALVKAQQDLAQTLQSNARLQEALVLKEAGELVASRLAASTLPVIAHKRLQEALVAKATVKEGKLDTAAFETVISEAVKAEVDYLAAVAGSGAIVGMGGGAQGGQQQQGGADAAKRLQEALVDLGLGEKTAKSVVL